MAKTNDKKTVVRVLNPIYENRQNLFPGDILIMTLERASALGSSVEIAEDKRIIPIRGEDVICDKGQ